MAITTTVRTKKSVNEVFKSKDVQWGPIGKEVYLRTYSRLKPDGTQESWQDTVLRVVDGNLALVNRKFHEPNERERLIELIYSMDMIPAGRHLWVSGVPGRAFLYNCHSAGFSRKDFTAHFTFTFEELMKGGGVGSNYSNKYIEMYPPVFCKVNLHIVCNPAHPNVDEFQEMLSKDFDHYAQERFVVDDSREGWSAALQEVLLAAWHGKDSPLIVDVSMLRERGALLKSFGGKSSGPGPLVIMLKRVADILSAKVGKKLTSLDMMTIDHEIATCVVSGNIRRSARMSIKHWGDVDILDFIRCKRDPESHWSTNISVEVDEKFFHAFRRGEEKAKMVLKEVSKAMHKNGEPGFWNSSLAAVGEVEYPFTTNPCVTGETLVATPDGYRHADAFKPGDEILTAYGMVGKVKDIERYNAVPTYRITFSDGGAIKVTESHQFHALRKREGRAPFYEQIMVRDLQVGDMVRICPAPFEGAEILFKGYEGIPSRDMAFLIGVLIGDGCYTESAMGASGVKIATDFREEGWNSAMMSSFAKVGAQLHVNRDNDRWYTGRLSGAGLKEFIRNLDLPPSYSYEKRIPLRFLNADKAFRLGLLDGIISTDGTVSVVGASPTIRIISASHGLIEDLRLLFLSLGVTCRSYTKDPKGGVIDGREIKRKHECYELCIFGGSLIVLASMLKLTHPDKEKKLEQIRKFCSSAKNSMKARITSIEPAGEATVYDLFESSTDTWLTQGYVSRGCGEISFEQFENCNLGHINLERFAENDEAAKEAFRLMTRFLVRATFGDVLNPYQKAVQDRNRRIGVGFFGFHPWLVYQGVSFSGCHHNKEIRNKLKAFRHTCRDEARRYAFQLRIPEPIKVTTIAPTGTVSLLAGTTSGCQPIFARFYKRLVNYSSDDPNLKALAEQGHPMEDSLYTPKTKVVTFFCKDPLVAECERRGFDLTLVEDQHEIEISDHLAVQAMLQDEYADNSISYTINFRDAEVKAEEIETALKVHLPHLKGTTLMPENDSRPQTPFQRITKAEFEEAEKRGIGKVSDSERECLNGVCPVK